MKSSVLFATSGLMWAFLLPTLPSFDWEAAAIVGIIVTVAAAAVIGAAIVTPFVAIVGGTTIVGTALAIGGIAVITGCIGAAAAGFYWGREGDIKRLEQIESIKRVSNQLDIYFDPSAGDPARAADFQCTLVVYEETDLTSRQPTVTTKKIHIRDATDGDQFHEKVNDQLKNWFRKPVQGDKEQKPRRVMVFMSPYPGEGIYERLKRMAEQNGAVRCNVLRSDEVWTSSAP